MSAKNPLVIFLPSIIVTSRWSQRGSVLLKKKFYTKICSTESKEIESFFSKEMLLSYPRTITFCFDGYS